jgi:hypothetical protein
MQSYSVLNNVLTPEVIIELPRIPIFRVAAGLIFLLAGLLAYYGIIFEAPIALVLVIAGVAIVVAVFAGHRSRPGDLAAFVIALLVLAAVGAGLNFQSFSGPVAANYSAGSSSIPSNRIILSAKSSTGSISIDFSSNSSVGYEVTFRRSFVGFQFFPGVNNYSLTNSTRNGDFFLNASTNYMSIQITLGQQYFTNISASTGTGSIDLKSDQSVSFGDLSLMLGTGSLSANVQAKTISSLYLSTGTGSLDFESSNFNPAGPKVPVTASTGTGSLTFKATIPSAAAVSLNASTGFGSISQSLAGFTVSRSTSGLLQAYSGNINTAAASFLISLSTGTGSASITIQRS